MFPRGHSCLKRCGHLSQAVLDHIAATAVAEEPQLIFLYPHWFTSTIQRQRSMVSTASANLSVSERLSSSSSRVGGLQTRGGADVGNSGIVLSSTRVKSRSQQHVRKHSFGASTRRWISSHPTTATAAEDDVSETGSPSIERGKLRAGVIKRNGSQTGKEEVCDWDGRTESPSQQTVRENHTSPNASADSGDGESTTALGRRVPGKIGRLGTKPASAIYVKRPRRVRKERTTIRQLSVRERRKLRNRMYWTKYAEGFVRSSRWGYGVRDMLEILQRGQGMRDKKRDDHLAMEEPKEKEILVPEETVALLAGVSKWTMAENIWYVPVRNGCKVHVLPPVESEGQNRRVRLTGTEYVIGLVAERIRQSHDLQQQGDPLIDIRKPVVPVFPSIRALERRGISPPLVRGVWDFHSSRRAAQIHLVLNRTKRLSTVREFTEHVEELVKSLPSTESRHRQPHLSHPDRVTKILMSLFGEKNQSLFSTAALNLALSFLLEHRFLTYARRILARAEHVATVDTFNLLLKSAAMKQDIRSFRGVLRMMARMQIRPDAFTWLAYLDCLVSPRAKNGLIRYMEHQGFLKDTPVMRTVLQLTIQETFMEHLKRGGTVDEFFSKTVKTAGTNWFSPSLIGQMFSVTVRLENTTAMDRLLEICKEQGMAIENRTSSTICQIALLFRTDIFSLLPYVFRCIDDPNPKLSKDACERLFLIAFKGHHFNTCRIIWRYACMNGTVTHKMKDAVTFSLTQNVGRRDRSELDNIWRTSAGKVIVGVDLHLPDYPARDTVLQDVPPEFHHQPVSCLATGIKSYGEERSRQHRVARAIVDHDIEIGTWYRPVYPFATMLEAAATMDKEWVGLPRPTKWLMQNAIQFPVKLSDYQT